LFFLLFDFYGLHLGADAEFRGLETMILGHGFFCAVYAVQYELAKVGIADFSAKVEVGFFFFVCQKKMVASGALDANVHVLPLFDEALGSEYDGTAVAPVLEAVRGEPVYAEVIGRAVISHDDRVAEIFQLRVFGMVVIADLA
jgi:hypothetical protein